MSAPDAPRLWIKIVLPGGQAIGPGKIALMEAVETHGSISAAARSLDMSYRRAWLLLSETSALLGEDVIATSIGGAAKGGAELTAAGRELIAIYRGMEARADEASSANLSDLARRFPRLKSQA